MYAPVWFTIPAGPFLMGSAPGGPGQPFANESPGQQLDLAGVLHFARAGYQCPVRKVCPGDEASRTGKLVLWPVPAGKAQPRLRISIGAMPRNSVPGPLYACRVKRNGRRLHAAPMAGRGPGAATHPTRRAVTSTRPIARPPVQQDTSPVDAYPSGASPYGVLDMVGNVWEWTNSLYRQYPYRAADGRESPVRAGRCVVRGGTYNHGARHIRCAARAALETTARDVYTGFRVATSDPSIVRGANLRLGGNSCRDVLARQRAANRTRASAGR